MTVSSEETSFSQSFSATNWPSNHDDFFYKVKTTTCVIVAALAVITLLAATFVIMAKQGIPLGGINSFVKIINVNWCYIALIEAGVILFIDFVIYKDVRWKKRIEEKIMEESFTPHETDELKIPNETDELKIPKISINLGQDSSTLSKAQFEVSDESQSVHDAAVERAIFAKFDGETYCEDQQGKREVILQPKEYIVFNIVYQGRPVYVVAFKEDENTLKGEYFFHKEKRDGNGSSKMGYIANELKGWVDKTDLLKKATDPQDQKSQNGEDSSSEGLASGALSEAEQEESLDSKVFKKALCAKAEKAIVAIFEHAGIEPSLKDHEYLAFEFDFDGSVMYAVAVPEEGKEDEFDIRYEEIKEERDAIIEKELKGWTDFRKYTNEDVEKTIKPDDLAKFKKKNNKKNTFYTSEFAQNIFALAVWDAQRKVHYLYFKAQEFRDEYIKTQCVDYLDVKQLEINLKIMRHVDRIDLFCTKPNEFWPVDTNINGVDVQTLLIKKENDFTFVYWRFCDNQDDYFKTTYFDNKDYVNAKDRREENLFAAINNNEIDETDFWAMIQDDEEQNAKYLFFKQQIDRLITSENPLACMTAEFDIAGKTVYAMGTKNKIRIFNFEKDKDTAIQQAGLYDLNLLVEKIYGKNDGLIKRFYVEDLPEDGLFITDQFVINDKSLYVVVFRISHSVPDKDDNVVLKADFFHKVFFNEADRTRWLNETRPTVETAFFNDNYLMHDKPGQYAPWHFNGISLSLKEDIEEKKAQFIKSNEPFMKFDIQPWEGWPKIGVLICQNKNDPSQSQVLYFFSQRAREDFINNLEK